jgi:hypothetical protein
MTSRSVEELRGAGLNAETVASLLASKLPEPAAKELWIVDESSLLATKSVNGLLKTAREQGVGRIVFVGDQKQHQAIEAGALIKQFLRDNMAVASLTVVRRQRDPELKQAVEREKPRLALQLLEEQGRVHEIEDASTRYSAISIEYLRSHQAGHTTLVVSLGNDERRALNETIRGLLVKEGQIDKHGQEHAILVNRDLTKAQIRHAGSYQPGDVVHFSQRFAGIATGSYLTVKSVDWNENKLTLFGRDGQEIVREPRLWKKVSVYQWEQREIAVGDRLQFRIHDKKNSISNGSFCCDPRAERA